MLKQCGLFVTHGGGNSLQEAIECVCPTLVIPFFGDQFESARRVETHGIGMSLASTQNANMDTNRSEVVESESESGLLQDDIQSKIMHIFKHRDMFVQSLHNLCQEANRVQSEVSSCLLVTSAFKPSDFSPCRGDLLFGTNIDRACFTRMYQDQQQGDQDPFRLGHSLPFSQLFPGYGPATRPRLIDQYNDVLRNPAWLAQECGTVSSSIYPTWLREYESFLKNEHHFDIGSTNHSQDALWNMCVLGLEFFVVRKGVHVHFALDSFVPNKNKATSLEVQWILANPSVRQQITFYSRLDTGWIRSSPPRILLL